ncbi:uncharacterized protein DS421_11g326990 [Arachis hypogaea]|nr:uncharacterized protein DS421_11g326990 [Arachis hypogaea]
MLENMRKIQQQERDAFEAMIMAGYVLENHIINNSFLNQKSPITSNPMPLTSDIVPIPSKPPDEKKENLVAGKDLKQKGVLAPTKVSGMSMNFKDGFWIQW